MYERTYNSNYDSSLSTTDIAKKVRQEIAKMKKTGDLDKGFKFSIRAEYFSGGSAIRASITAVPEGVEAYNSEYYDAYNRGESTYAMSRFSAPVKAASEKVLALINSFNYDGSESMVDYFDVNFYCHSCDPAWNKFDEPQMTR